MGGFEIVGKGPLTTTEQLMSDSENAFRGSVVNLVDEQVEIVRPDQPGDGLNLDLTEGVQPEVDLSGVTTEALIKELSPRLNADQIKELLRQVYTADAEAVKAQSEAAIAMYVSQAKQRSDISGHAQAFIQELAGLEAFEHTYNIAGTITVTFRTLDSQMQQEVGRQAIVDINSGRLRSNQLTEVTVQQREYTMIGSIATFQVLDLQSRSIVRYYSRDVAIDLEANVGDYDPKRDYAIRHRQQYVTNVLLATGTLRTLIMQKYSEFESLLRDLTILAEHEPDFFSNFFTSTGTS